MQASALLLRWGSYRRAHNLRFLIVYLFFSPFYVALCASKARHRFGSEKVSWCLETSLFKTPFPGRNSVPSLFCLFFCLLYFFLPPFEELGCFSGCLMSSASIQSCFVEFTRRLNALLMNLWGRKCSPRPTPPPSWLLLCTLFLTFLRFIQNC